VSTLFPTIIYDGVGVNIRITENKEEREELLKNLLLPLEIKGFINRFDELLISPSTEEAIVELAKDEKFFSPHFFYIFSDNHEFIEGEVRKLRQNPTTVLSPVFVSTNPYTEITTVIDGIFKSYSKAIVDKSLEIWEIVEKFAPNPYAASLPEHKRINLIRFLTSRSINEEKPTLKKEAIMGFFYPRAYYIISPRDLGEEVYDLKFLESLKIMESSVDNKTSLCPFCEHYNLIFREICPSCGSVRIKLVEFIHHYSCGYIGPVTEFIKGDKLVCPKCHEELKHIGVDYDKPLEKYLCENCGSRFLEPDVDVLCANCKKKSTPEEIKTEFINTFSLTPFGKIISFEGNLPINVFEEITTALGIVGLNVFTFILEKFLTITERYERPFCVMGILFKFPGEVISELPLRIRTFIKDLIKVIKDNLRSSDIVSASENKYIFVILPETPPEGGKRVKERLSEQIERLLKKNKFTNLIKYSIAVECVTEGKKYTSSQELLDNIIKELEKNV